MSMPTPTTIPTTSIPPASTKTIPRMLLVLALSLLAACGGGGGNSGSDTASRSAGEGEGGDGGSASPPITSSLLADFASSPSGTTGMTGGLGRMTLMVDNAPAIVSLIDMENVEGLLENPNKVLLLRLAEVGSTPRDLFIWGWDNARPVYNPDNIQGILGAEEPVRARDNFTQLSGKVYPLDAGLGTKVYIDDYAPVAMALRQSIGGMIGNVLTIGAPYGGETSLPVGDQTYAGAVSLHGLNRGDNRFAAFRGEFGLTANFDKPNPRVTHFSSRIDFIEGVLIATDLAINLSDGTFGGDIALDASKSPLIREDAVGEIFGQFHGEGATGVTGLYHNGMTGNDGNNLVFGGFAGSNQCLTIQNSPTPTC